MHKKLLFITLLWLGAISSMAQSLTIVEDFKIIENSSALVAYHNQFSDYEKPAMDDTFPYAVVRVLLEGNAHEVTSAKKMLGVYTGLLSEGVKASYLDFENEILFLVPSNVGHVELSCGEGCTRQVILHLQHLQSNAVYVGKVHYTPAAPLPDPTPNLKKQTFIFEVYPKNASVEVLVNGANELCQIDEDIQKITLTHGTYRYMVSSPRYQTEEGMISVSDSSRTRTVKLLPNYGWLSLTATEATHGASVYATNLKTNERIVLGNVPVAPHELDAGEYQLQILQNKYKNYTKHIRILANDTLTESPVLEPNFSHVALTTDEASEIYVNGDWYGTGSWSGTLELGEYSIETRKANHKSAYTLLNVSDIDANQKIQLQAPTPIYGSLSVDGNPVRAAIYVDNKYMGESPMIINDLLIGEHQIRIEKAGNQKHLQTIVLQENEEKEVRYTLQKGLKPNQPFPKEKTKVGDLYYEGSTKEPYTVTVVAAEDKYTMSKVYIPENIVYGDYIYDVKAIASAAFFGCTQLTSLNIPQTVDSIGFNAFSGCTSLSQIIVDKGNTTYDSRNNSNAIIGTKTNTLLLGCHNTIIPNTVNNIAWRAFQGDSTFTSIFIPANVINISQQAFIYCGHIEKIVVSSENKVYDSRENCNAVIETKTNTLVLGCQNTIIPRDVVKIGVHAFHGCDEMTSIFIPRNIIEIGEHALVCKNLSTIEVEAGNPKYDSRNACNAVIESSTNTLVIGCMNTVIPNSVKKIGEGAFAMTNLKSVIIPRGVTNIGEDAFLYCENLESITIPKSVKEIGEYAFSYCSSLKLIKLPIGLTKIGSSTFYGCEHLETIIIPNNVAEIGSSAFAECASLKSISLPAGLTEITTSTFRKCINLETITIPNGVNDISGYAFEGCKSLKTIKLPSSTEYVAWRAFTGCEHLETIYFNGVSTYVGEEAFHDCPNLQTIYIPRGTKAKFAAMEGLKGHVGKLVEK